MYDVIILGGGPAGITASIYAARAGFKTLVLEMGMPGGQAATTDLIENYPGFPEGAKGPELMMNFHQQAVNFGVEFKFQEVTALELTGEVKEVKTPKESYQAKAIIIATGAEPRNLNVAGEQELRGKGVSYCSTCDGFFFKDKDILAIGGGDTALQESLFLSKICNKITIIHRRDEFRGAQILQDRVRDNEKIDVIWDSVVDEFVGEEKLEKVRLKNLKTGELTEKVVDGAFVFVGYLPKTKFLPEDIALDEAGYVLTDKMMKTNVSGVFAIGDVRQKLTRQVATAVGDGAIVLKALEEYFD